jgi:hypothetical protein
VLRLGALPATACFLLGCDLGIDESQIGSGGAPAGGTALSASSATGPGSSAASGSAGSSSGASTSSASTAASTSASSSSTGGSSLGQVRCYENGQIVDCAPGDVCCHLSSDLALDHCSAVACPLGYHQFACDEPGDCAGSEDCCAPNEIDGDIACQSSCQRPEYVVCETDNDCMLPFVCTDQAPMPYGSSYERCWFF